MKNNTKKIVNQSCSMDAEEKRMYFVEFEDGTSRCYLIDSVHTGYMPPREFWSYDYDKNDIENETVIKAARMKDSFTNRVYR